MLRTLILVRFKPTIWSMPLLLFIVWMLGGCRYIERTYSNIPDKQLTPSPSSVTLIQSMTPTVDKSENPIDEENRDIAPTSQIVSLDTPVPTRITQTLDIIDLTMTVQPSPEISRHKILGGDYYLIEDGYSNDVIYTQWSDDDHLIYAARPETPDVPLEWFVFNFHTRQKEPIQSPIPYDRNIWEKMNVPYPGASSEIPGQLSPSGRYLVFTAPSSDQAACEGLWLVDTETLSKTLVSENYYNNYYCYDIYQLAWLPDESEAIIQMGYEGGGALFPLYVQQGRLGPGFTSTDQDWALSPNGKILAINHPAEPPENIYILSLINLSDGSKKIIGEERLNPWWTADGKQVCYWKGRLDQFETGKLFCYVVGSGEEQIVFDVSELAEDGMGMGFSNFSISPSGHRIAFWGGWLRLIDFNK